MRKDTAEPNNFGDRFVAAELKTSWISGDGVSCGERLSLNFALTLSHKENAIFTKVMSRWAF
jgi:hypothetical protein